LPTLPTIERLAQTRRARRALDPQPFRAIGCANAALVAGCGSTLLMAVLLSARGSLPMQVDRPFSPALKPSPDSPLVRIAQNSSPAPALTGFRLMPLGVYSLDARIQLARRARLTRATPSRARFCPA
jgi:hypothetical protein